MRVSSDDCLNGLKTLAGKGWLVSADLGNDSLFLCRVSGLFALNADEEFVVAGKNDLLSFSIDAIRNCFIDSRVLESGSATLDSATGVSIATINLTDKKTTITLRRLKSAL